MRRSLIAGASALVFGDRRDLDLRAPAADSRVPLLCLLRLGGLASRCSPALQLPGAVKRSGRVRRDRSVRRGELSDLRQPTSGAVDSPGPSAAPRGGEARARPGLRACCSRALLRPSRRAAEPSAAQLAQAPEALPSAPPLPPAIRKKIALELASRSSDYEPRTRNLRPDGSPEYSNRLLLEDEPLSPAARPQPRQLVSLGRRGLRPDARRLGRPVLMSIGYSTCHWCHVMEEESFDTVAASLLPERALHRDQGRPRGPSRYRRRLHGGGPRDGEEWRLAAERLADSRSRAVLRRDLFPRRDPIGGRPGFLDVLRRRINEAYTNDRATWLPNFRRRSPVPSSSSSPASPRGNRAFRIGRFSIPRVGDDRAGVSDRAWGGTPGRTEVSVTRSRCDLLLRHYRFTGEKEALTLATLTLEKMAAGRDLRSRRRWLSPLFDRRRNGSSPTSKRCSTTTRCWRSSISRPRS